MRRAVSTPFFPSQGYSMFDSISLSQAGATNQAMWTYGKTATRPAALGGPTPSERWQLISVSVQGYLRWAYDAVTAPVVHGKLGAILCGLNMDETVPTQNDDQYLVAAYQLPADTTLVETLWDPNVHPMPPTTISSSLAVPAATPSTALAMSATIIPSNPIELQPGVNPVVGIWMLPSLLGWFAQTSGGIPNGIGLDIGMARFTINYDDGM